MTRIHYIADSDEVWGEHEVDYIFLIQKPNIQALLDRVNPNEVGEVLFVDPPQLRAMLRRAELYRGEALSPQEAAEEAAEAARAEAAGEQGGSAVRGVLALHAVGEGDHRAVFVPVVGGRGAGQGVEQAL